MVVLEVRGPEVPVIVTVAVPAGAGGLWPVNVSALLPVVGLVPKAAVTPLGRPETDSATLPVKPPLTVIVSLALPPWAMLSVGSEGVSTRLEQVVPLMAKEAGTALVTPFQVPLKPTPV